MTESPAAHQPVDWKWLSLPVLLYIISIALTQPPFIGDTQVYAAQIAASHGLAAPALWEFGHILWRPIGFILSPLFLGVIPDSIAWTRELKVSYELVCLNLLSGLISTLFIYDLSRRLIRSPIVAMVPVLIFVWGDAVLSYSQSGTSYIPALTALIAGVWVQLTAPRADRKMLVGSACLFGIACLLWLPFLFVLPAAACARKFAPLRETDRWDWTRVIANLVIASVVLTVGVAVAAFMAGVRSLPEFTAWRSAASHDWHQNRQWIRAISGCPRLLIDLGLDGINLKRFTFKDPYNPVSALTLVRLMLWKIGWFYIFMASIVALAWTSLRARPALGLAALAGLPMLLFAVILFEPSSPERFLPVLPFLLLAIAAGWNSTAGKARWLRGVICLFMLTLPVLNWPTFAGSFSAQTQQTRARLDDLRKSAGAHDILLTINLQDPIIQLIDQNLFDAANRPTPFRNYWLIDIADEHAALWRRRFALYVLDNWHGNHDVWVTKYVLADRPDANTYWVEGDNPAVHWSDIASFFKTIEFDRKTSRSDGFVRLSRSPEIEDRLAGIANHQ